MPFGLRNAAQTFQRFIDEVLRGLPFAYVYIDDVLKASANPQKHREHLKQVFERLQQYDTSSTQSTWCTITPLPWSPG